MDRHESFLAFRRYRHLKQSLVLVLVAIGLYVADDPPGGPHGGTWFGYGAGVVSAGLVFWLMWLSMRKRDYFARAGSLRGWLSAHVYFGLTPMVLVPLHCGFQFGMNVHTAAFVLLVLVVLSGAVGVVLYRVLPNRVAVNLQGQKPEALLERIANLDADCAAVAQRLPDVFAEATRAAIDDTRMATSLIGKLRGNDPSCATTKALDHTLAHEERTSGAERDQVKRLLHLLTTKQAVLLRLRRDIQLKALLELWLLAHVPFAFATTLAVFAHISLVLYYR